MSPWLPALLLLLAGCSFIPALPQSPLPVASQWPPAARPDGQQGLAGLMWQRMFPDPRLQGLILAALEHNRDLRIAVARVEEARALHGLARADLLPTLNLTTSQSAARLPGDLAASGQKQISRRHDVGLGVSAFELDFWGRVRSLNTAAQAAYLASEEARRAFQLSLMAEVAGAYLTQREMTERLALARDTVTSRQESRFLVQRRRDAGLAGDLDLMAADAALAAAQAEMANLARGLAQADHALTLLVGTTPAELPEPRSLRAQEIPLDLAVEAPATVLLARPDVRAAEQKLKAANANIGAARAAFLPRVGINLALGTASRSVGGLFDAGSGAWTFAPTLVEPLFDSGRTAAAVDLAEARQVVAVAEYEKAIQQAFREVADLLAARERLAEQLQAQEALEATQTRRLALVQARQQGGAASYLEVLDAQREAANAQQGTVQTRRALLATGAQLYKALGGGGLQP